MDDLLTRIEEELKNALLKIRVDTPLPKYEFYNTVDVVNMEDECIAVEYGQYPTISVYLDPEEDTELGMTSSYYNEARFKLVCSVAMEDQDDTPRFAINKKMNELLSDLKALFPANYTLNCTCSSVELTNSSRVYNDDGDIFRVGDLHVYLTIKYYQSIADPRKTCLV